MTIWFISKYASPPQYTKWPSRLFYVAKEMGKLGNDVLLITSDSNHFSKFPDSPNIYNDEYEQGVHIKWLKTFQYSTTGSIRRILSWFDFEFKLFRMKTDGLNKPDVVHVSSLSIFTIIYGYYLKRKFNAFLVFESRDIWPLTMTEEGGFSKFHPLVILIGWIEKFGYRKADLIVGTMPNLKEHVYNRIGHQKPFYCLPMGFNPQDYLEEQTNAPNPFSKLIPENKVIIGYAGSFGITNALELLMETIKSMADNNHVFFALAGSGDLKQTYTQELRNCKNVLFIDRIEQDDVKHFLSLCDILYLSTQPSEVWKYGQSMNKVVEYMLAAKPIIASYNGYPSMINEADCGQFVKSRDPNELKFVFLKFAVLSNEERNLIGLRGRSWVFENRPFTTLALNYLNKLKSEIKQDA